MRFFPTLLLCAGLALPALLPAAAWGGPVDINTADARTLAKELNGIGPARAEAIVAYRSTHGPFKSVDELALVKNIPPKVIESNRELLRVGGARAAGGKTSSGGARSATKVDAGSVARAAPKARKSDPAASAGP